MNKQKIRLTQSEIDVLNNYKFSKDCSASELRRIQAILLLDTGKNKDLIKELTNFNTKYVSSLRKKYRTLGIEGIQDPPPKKPRSLLTKGQRNEIILILTRSTPKNFGFNTDHWTTSILALIIEEQYNVKYKSKTSLYLIFKEAKFTYHKPDKQYKNRNQSVIDQWKTDNFSKIKSELENENTVVLTEDEMMLSTQTTTQKIWLPRGEFPKIDVSSKKEIRCIYGFLNVQNGVQHAFKTLRANSEATCEVLDKIGAIYKNKKIVIIWDNASWHRSALIRDYLSKTKHNFYLIALPPYAPELNPQEHVWKAGREKVTHNAFIGNIDTATDQFIEYLNNTCFKYKFC